MRNRRILVACLASLAAISAAAAAEIPVTGRVLGPGGSALSDAQVLLLPVLDPVAATKLDREGRPQEPAAKAVTTAQGEFRLAAPRAGVYRVRVESPGFAPRERALVPLLEAVDLPEVKLLRDPGLTLRVTDRAGAPIEGAVAHAAESAPRGPAEERWGLPPATVYTGKDGTARLPQPDAERVVLTVSAPGYLLVERRGVRGDSLTVKLEKGPQVAIDVRAADGTPAAGVVAATGETFHPLDMTDAKGRVVLALPARGDLAVTFFAADGRRVEERLSPPPKDRPAPIRLVLPDRLAVSGRVIDLETRRPVAEALVWNSNRPWEASVTGDAGGYALGVLPGEGGVVIGGAAGYLLSEPRPVTAPSGGRPGPTLALEPAAAVEGVVVDGDGQPVAGAGVDLVRRMEGGMYQVFIGGRSTAPHAVTTARGRFRLSPVDAAPRYDLKVNAQGFAAASRELSPLERRRTLGDLRIELQRGRTAAGRIVDGDGRSIEGASVALRASPRRRGGEIVLKASGGPAPEERSGLSGASGRFEIAALAAGTYDLAVRRKGFARKTVDGVEIAETPEPTDLGDVVLSPGERVQGRTVDPAGKPVGGVEVAFVKDQSGPVGFGRGLPSQPETVSAPDGWFSIEDLPRGEPLHLVFSRTGFLAKRETGIEVPRRDPLEVVLHPSSKVSGTVVGPDGKPIPLAQVTLTAQRGGGVGGQRILMVMRRPGTADSAGKFVFEDVEPGKIALGASASGWQEAKLDDLEVVEGQDLTDVELPLKQGALVEGRVLAPDGRPAVGAEVSKVQEQAQMVRFRGTGTDGDGYYRIEGLAPGKVSIEATHESWARVVKDLDAKPGANILDLQFQGGQDVSGRVVDSAGAPVAGATVQLATPGRFFGGSDTSTDGDGGFRFEGVGDGDYVVLAAKRGYAAPADRPTVHVGGAPVTDLTVKLEVGVVVTGTVSGLDPEKLSKVDVRAEKSGGGWPQSSSAVDRQGRYRLEDLASGAWRLVAYHVPSGQQARGDLTIAPGATEATLDLRFGGGITLSGRAVQGDTPVRGADLALTGTDVESSGRGRTDADGRFSIGGLDPGTYQLELNQWETGLFHEEKLEVRGPRELIVRVPTARISGRVVDSAERRPVSGVHVTVSSQDPDASRGNAFRLDRSSSTDLDGRFSIANVADGSWRVSATAEGYAARSADVTVRSGRDVDSVSLALDATEGLTLLVTLPSGQPPAEVVVSALDAGGRSILNGGFATGENGRVRLSTVPPGSWDLLVGAGGSATFSFRATAPGGPVPVQLPPACVLDVRVPALEGSAGVAVDETAAAAVTAAVPRPQRASAHPADERGDRPRPAGALRGRTRVNDEHDARHSHEHAGGHAHDRDLRYFSHEAQPEVFAATADLTFPSPLDPDQVEAAVRAFLGRLSLALAAAGCVLVGHVKGVVTDVDENELGFSLTTLEGEPRFDGSLPDTTDRAVLTVNVIVFGVPVSELPGVVIGAWPEERACATWRSHVVKRRGRHTSAPYLRPASISDFMHSGLASSTTMPVPRMKPPGTATSSMSLRT